VPVENAQPRALAPARAVAFRVVLRVFEEDAFADRALRGEAERARLDRRDLALATRLAFGTVQRRLTLDHVIEHTAGRPVGQLDPEARAALRLGAYQLLYADGIPAHAAVGESVELAKSGRGGGARLVNAVLRRLSREGAELVDALDDATPEGAALAHSHPEWLARLWWDQLGPDAARALMARNNEPAEAALRVNTLVAEPGAVAAELGVPAHPAEGISEALVLDGPFDAHGSPLWAAGAFMPQSRAAMLVGRVTGALPGERVLDLCAAPGGKATHLAALMEGRGEVVAVERHPGRAGSMAETVRRMRAAGVVRIETADAAVPRDDGPFARVLVDPPCSALGTLAGRPDARWRGSRKAIAELAQMQAQILDAGASAVAPGGTLTYSTCTISAAENEGQVDAFLARHDGWEADDLQAIFPLWKHPRVARHLLTLPHRDETDGFFIARLRRTER
jgi:16S rRNA (cytosine967-C5)-methyltransferase